MSDVRLVEAPISVRFSLKSDNPEGFERDYQSLSESDEDPIGQWLRGARARGESYDSDPVIIHLLVELHRKIDRLEQTLNHTLPKQLPMTEEAMIDGIGFEHFKLVDPKFVPGSEYYGRVEIPIYPKREIGMYFEAVDSPLARIVRIHSRDEREWGAYMTARERAMIRHLKGLE